MKSKSRSILAVPLLAVLAAAGCNKADKPAADAQPNKTDAAAAKGDQIAGLPTEKDQVSYMIGMQMAKPLVLAKDDVDVDAFERVSFQAAACTRAKMATPVKLATLSSALQGPRAWAEPAL